MFEELIAKLKFWKAKNFVVLDKHYEFMLDISDKNSIPVRILKKYPGVIVEYSNIRMSTENEMSYDINVIANPNLCRVENKNFDEFTTAILRSIILGSIEHAKESNENGNIDTVESDSERSIHEEVVTVSEERIPERKPRKKAVRGNKAVYPKV